jgi:hypothetical protein
MAAQLIGVDFSSAPTRRKPITVAIAQAGPGTVALREIQRFDSLPHWHDWLAAPGEWLGAFDFPFGLPRAFVEGLGWPLAATAPWRDVTQRLAALSRAQLIEQCRAWCDARPVGSKFAHRATDLLAGSSPSMKWINPPVALMLHAGAPRLLEAGVTVPGLTEQGTDPGRIALEGYPGLLARAVLGRQSYKSDDPKHRQDPLRQAAREALVQALEAGEHPFEVRVDFQALRHDCIEEAGADLLDAVLCLAQAAWAWHRRDRNWGLPAVIDPIEGWILGAEIAGFRSETGREIR